MAEQENGLSLLAEALARVGDRWTLLVVEAPLGGLQRFNDLLGQIPRNAANILGDGELRGSLTTTAAPR
jgi:DNA-binding HxlR family transcriptional regulator